MSYRILGFVALLLALIAGGTQSLAAGVKPPDQVFQLHVERAKNGGLRLGWRIASGSYLYRDRIAAVVDSRSVRVDTAPGEQKDDPNFGVTEIYRGSAAASVAPESLPAKGSLIVTYQGCRENVICYPPVRKAIDLATLSIADEDAAKVNAAPAPLADGFGSVDDTRLSLSAGASNMPASSEPTAKRREPATLLLDNSLPSLLIAFLGLGLLLSLTPCVFPMIPIMSGMLARSGGNLSWARGLAMSSTYVMAMAVAYGLLGVFAAWSGHDLQAVLQTPAALVAMSLVFVGLSLSMFGLFEIQLPHSWTSRISGAAGHAGSIGGAAALGFTSALIVGPCVTPPLAAALVFVAQTGAVVRGSLALFTLGLGMGLPLILVGVLGVKVLPRSGPWLISIKHVFGLVFVALAIWMTSRIMPPRLATAAWGVFFLAVGTYAIAAVIRVERHRWTQLALAGIGALAICYGGALAVGAGLGAYEPLRPLAVLGVATFPGDAADDGFRVVTNAAELTKAIDSAREQGKPVMIDFSAAWCTECQVMDRAVFTRTTVRRELRGLLLVRADLTHFGPESQNLMNQFGVVGPPTVVFLRPDGNEIREARVVGDVGVSDFLSKVAVAFHS